MMVPKKGDECYAVGWGLLDDGENRQIADTLQVEFDLHQSIQVEFGLPKSIQIVFDLPVPFKLGNVKIESYLTTLIQLAILYFSRVFYRIYRNMLLL